MIKLLQSTGLILGTILCLLIGFPGLTQCMVIWIMLSMLFLASRISRKVPFFTEWSWLQFGLTIALALGIPYVFVVLSFNF